MINFLLSSLFVIVCFSLLLIGLDFNDCVYFQKDYKGKYHELRNIEVVRSEIENYEDIWLSGFVEDTTQSSKFSGYKKSREIRRQKWLHILLSSTYQHVIFLRNLILLHGVRLSYLTWFNESRYKQLGKLQGYHRQVELIKLKVKYLE